MQLGLWLVEVLLRVRKRNGDKGKVWYMNPEEAPIIKLPNTEKHYKRRSNKRNKK